MLRVDGLVDRVLELNDDDLARLPEGEQVRDLARLYPKRPGDAVRLSAIMALAGVAPAAQYVTLHAGRDDFHASIPLSAVQETGLIIYRLNGGPLTPTAGGPLRFFIPNHAACHLAEVDECANVKFLDRLEFSSAKGQDNRPQEEREHAALHARQNTAGA